MQAVSFFSPFFQKRVNFHQSVCFGKNPKSGENPPPILHVETNVLGPRDLEALHSYFDANLDPNTVLREGFLANTLYGGAIADMSQASPGKTPVEFLEPRGILTRVMTRLKKAVKKGFKEDYQGPFKYSLLRYATSVGQVMDSLRWHSDGARYLGILTVRQPQVEGGLFQLRRKGYPDAVASVKPEANKMVVFQDMGNEHSVTEWQARKSNDGRYPDKAIRDVFTVQWF